MQSGTTKTQDSQNSGKIKLPVKWESEDIGTDHLNPKAVSKEPVPKIPPSPVKELTTKVDKEILKGKMVKVSITREWYIDAVRWDEYKEHLDRCHTDTQIVDHYNFWGLNWYMEGAGDPDKVSYHIQEIKPPKKDAAKPNNSDK